jgi:multiple sugar transport system permease protein
MIKNENRLVALFIIPSFAGVALFYFIPFVLSLGYAATDINGNFVGLQNFVNLFGNEMFRLAISNTVRFMVIAIPLNIVIPLLIACLLFNLNGSGWLKTVFMSPLVIPAACVAFFFQSLFTTNGLLSQIVGENINWLQTDYSFAIVVGVYVWRNMGFNLILALAGLVGIPKDYYEWAAVEGMGRIKMFFKITIVYLVPSLFIMFVMSFISSFRIFRELYMLAGSYPHERIYMIQHFMNNQFARLNYQNLTTAAFALTLGITVFMIIFFMVDKKAEFGE